MSKATFYEHFANKEECILALFDEAAAEIAAGDGRGVRRGRARTYAPSACTPAPRPSWRCWPRYPDASQTLLVEIIGAGPRGDRAPRRDPRRAFADGAHARERERRAQAARCARLRLAATTPTRVVGAIVELVSLRSCAAARADDVARARAASIERLMLRRRCRSSDAPRRWPRSRHEVTTCRRCPRLVAWREQVAREKRARSRDETTGAGPLPGFGDPDARVLVLGLAPAAHGANRTGRVFTGDRSGDWLFAAPAPRRPRQPGDVGLARRRAARCAARGSPRRCAARRRPTADARRARRLPAVERAPSSTLLPRSRVDRLPRSASPGTPRCACAPRSARRRPRRGRASATAPLRRRRLAGRCSAASTPASRTRSPGG